MSNRRVSLLASPWTPILLTFLPFAFAIGFIATHAVNVPYTDQWELVPLLEKTILGRLEFQDVWVQFNEHRILFPKLLMLGLAQLTHWDVRYEIGLSCCLISGVMLLIGWQIIQTSKGLSLPALRWAIPICSLGVFSFSQYENFLWGWQLTLFLSLFAVVVAIVLLGNPPFGWGKFVGSVLSALVGTYSFANGMLCWPIGVVLLWWLLAGRKERVLATTLWSLAGLLSIGAYLWRYTSPPEHPSLLALFKKPLGFVAYFFAYCGSICAHVGEDGFVSQKTWGVIFGAASLLLWAWAACRIWGRFRANFKTFAPYFALSAYSLGSALMTAIGRTGFGANQSLTSRYCTLTIPFWVCLILFLTILTQAHSSGIPGSAPLPSLTTPKKPHAGSIARWSLVTLIGLLALSSFFSVRSAEARALNLETARAYLQTLSPDPRARYNEGELFRLSISPKMVAERARVLRRYHLSLYRE
jgi:hypothetical protein